MGAMPAPTPPHHPTPPRHNTTQHNTTHPTPSERLHPGDDSIEVSAEGHNLTNNGTQFTAGSFNS